MSATKSESIPNRFDFSEAQTRLFKFWEESGYFNAEVNPDRRPYTIVIPPPNVTGALHLGHALNNTLQDTMIRMKRMQGFEALWMPGTDHAGIATQAVVEKRLREDEGRSRHDLGRQKLVERIWAWKDEYEARILGQLKRMGCSCDWRRTRFTLDPICARAVRHTFFDLFKKGWIYRGKRLVNWDTFLQTAVSDDEVFHETVKGHFWHMRYPVIDPKPGEPQFVVVATTRPETMLGDTAVATHPAPREALDRAEQDLVEKLAAAPAKDKPAIHSQLDNVRARRAEMLPGLETLAKMAREGRKLRLPLLGRELPLIADEWAKPEMGSGCVKITPAHDPNDYEVWQRHPEIGAINILNGDGTLNANAGPYQGLSVPEARKRVVADLESQQLLQEIEDREIDLAHSDRSKTPIEPYLADQWFVKMETLAQSAMDAVTDERVKIFPQRFAKGYLDWLSEKRDWPVSRQLWWGHRIPVWYAACTESVLKTAFAGRDDVVWTKGDGENQWLICALEEDLSHDALDAAATAEGFPLDEPLRQDTDVLDTWFSSALWPHSTLGWPEQTPELGYFYPTSVLITSRDIITLWVARMVLTGLNNMGDVPFREVFIHPKILDGYGETMSKMKGNGVDPIDVIEKFGPDALRFGLAFLCTETQDVRMPVQFECPHCQTLIEQTKENRQLGKIQCKKCGGAFKTQWARTDADQALPRGPVVSERFEQARNFVNKLWNASRFAMLNLDGYEYAQVDDAELAVEDRWILSRLATVTIDVTEALEKYHFAEAARSLYDFAWDEFCSFYLEMLKSRLQDASQRPVAQRVLAHTLDGLLRLLHPMIPFVTEEVWQNLNRIAPVRGLGQGDAGSGQDAASSIMIAAWPGVIERHRDATIEARFAVFQSVLGAVREIRTRQNIPSRTRIQFMARTDSETARLIEPMRPYFESMANADCAQAGEAVQPPATHAAVTARGIDVFVDLTGLIDVAAEIQRNEQQKKKLAGQVEGKRKKLENEGFTSRAPAEVVQKERESLAQLEEQLSAVEAALVELRKQGERGA